MTATVQAIYPATGDATFDYAYYVDTHLQMVRDVFGPHGLISVDATRGLSGAPGTPAPFFAIATMSFPDEASLQAALGDAGPVLADIPNFTTCTPQLLIGEAL